MIYVLEPQAMRAADAAAIAEVGEDALMRNAGTWIADRLCAMAPSGGRIVAFAGPGNNGGDAFAALAELSPAYDCTVYALAGGTPSVARAAAEARARAAGVATRALPTTEREARAALEDAIGVDGLFGTGARLPLPEAYVAAARALDARKHLVLAIDIPSGVDALTGAVAADAVRATVTVTLGAAKPGLLLDPARERAGELWYAEIGISDAILAAPPPTFAALDDEAFLRALPVRAAIADKRSSGAPLIVAGSGQFPGAAVLCARAAARAGAGYVTVAAPSSVAATLRAHLIEQVVIEIADEAPVQRAVEELLEIEKRNGSVGIGPGLGLDNRTGEIVAEFLARTTLPAVVDASALFHLSKRLESLRGKPVVVTPHAGEFARLSGKGTVAPKERVARVREFVGRTGITTLLKGRDTIVFDGTTVHVNVTGTNALATAGSGDVLTGTIATLLAQGLAPVDAARIGAYWHGLAGQLAARRRPVGVIAGDVADALAGALPTVDTEGRAAFAQPKRRGLWRIY
ncbi:MAG TPA: NAD(P)H-hydrate dehydratase [Candidatus Baltobacteraceae bacterium]|nr:NAD(P)H-hydrate dehydratase [Candidatus Baltobacteraceae bacterium]